MGELFSGEEFLCFSLEDTVRKVKIKGKTAIPSGTYEVIINWSNRFQKPMPLLLNVPGFQGIRIHPGNTAKDTDGCILIGNEKYANQIGESRQAFEEFYPKLKEALEVGKVFINVIGGNNAK